MLTCSCKGIGSALIRPDISYTFICVHTYIHKSQCTHTHAYTCMHTNTRKHTLTSPQKIPAPSMTSASEQSRDIKTISKREKCSAHGGRRGQICNSAGRSQNPPAHPKSASPLEATASAGAFWACSTSFRMIHILKHSSLRVCVCVSPFLEPSQLVIPLTCHH